MTRKELRNRGKRKREEGRRERWLEGLPDLVSLLFCLGLVSAPNLLEHDKSLLRAAEPPSVPSGSSLDVYRL